MQRAVVGFPKEGLGELTGGVGGHPPWDDLWDGVTLAGRALTAGVCRVGLALEEGVQIVELDGQGGFFIAIFIQKTPGLGTCAGCRAPRRSSPRWGRPPTYPRGKL
jgi:hypothetical protein